MKRIYNELDQKIDNIDFYSDLKMEKYSRLLKVKKVNEEDDPTEISIIPRLICKDEQREIEFISRKIINSAFGSFVDFLNHPDKTPKSPLNNFLKSLPFNQEKIIGLGRIDFLKEGSNYKMIEMNFLNLGSLRYIVEAQNIIFETFPELKGDFYGLNPISSLKDRLDIEGLEKVLILTKDDIEGSPRFLSRNLHPLYSEIVPISRYGEIKIDNNYFKFDGDIFDTIYPRYLSGSKGMEDELIRNKDFVSRLLKSKSIIIDSWKTMILEDKDLNYLVDFDSELEDYIPLTFNVNNFKKLDLGNYVLKVKDLHSGRGIKMSVKEDDINKLKYNAVLQKKVAANTYPVKTNFGNEGYAVYDTGVHVTYKYDIKKRELEEFEVSGFLSRFSLNGGIVNMMQGGGLIPVILEK